jgi:hypothetical protein
MNQLTEARIRALGDRCEHAKSKRCKCRCGGTLHGAAHGRAWAAKEFFRDRIRNGFEPTQVDWIGFASLEDGA